MCFHRIHPLGVDDSSSLGNVYSRQPTWPSNSENSSSFFVIKNCPGATVLKNPASVHNLINCSSIERVCTLSLWLYNKWSCSCSLVGSSQWQSHWYSSNNLTFWCFREGGCHRGAGRRGLGQSSLCAWLNQTHGWSIYDLLNAWYERGARSGLSARSCTTTIYQEEG